MSKKSRQKVEASLDAPESPADEARLASGDEGTSTPAESEAAPPAPVKTVSPAEPDEAPLTGDVTIGNLTVFTLQLPTASGHFRLGPKASVTLPATEVTEDTRLAARDGRIVLHPHT